MPDGAQAKARKNIEEGRGVSIGGALKGVTQITSLVHPILCGELHWKL